jgi:hypothetical protein
LKTGFSPWPDPETVAARPATIQHARTEALIATPRPFPWRFVRAPEADSGVPG